MILFDSERLQFRNFNTSDAKHLYGLNLNNEVIRFTGDPPFKSIKEALQFILDYSEYSINGMGRWAVELKSDDQFIGWCGLKKNPNGQVDLGMRFFEEQWNKGYATEASFACLKFGFEQLKLKEIFARTSIHNYGAQKVLLKIGMNQLYTFEYEGIGKSYFYSITKNIFQS